MRKKTIFLVLALLLAAACACAEDAAETEEYSYEAGVANLAEHGIDIDELIEEYDDIPKEGIPGFWFPYGQDGSPHFYLFDVTGDGCVDLCTGRTWGSGMVRTDTLVYDPVEHVRYTLPGYEYDYFPIGVENGRLIVVERGPKGRSDPMTDTYGTAVLEDGRLVFVPD